MCGSMGGSSCSVSAHIATATPNPATPSHMSSHNKTQTFHHQPQQQDVDGAVAGVDVVVHVATATPTSENALNKQLMDDVNVKGTQHVVNACKKHGVGSLVYTSSASGGSIVWVSGAMRSKWDSAVSCLFGAARLVNVGTALRGV